MKKDQYLKHHGKKMVKRAKARRKKFTEEQGLKVLENAGIIKRPTSDKLPNPFSEVKR